MNIVFACVLPLHTQGKHSSYSWKSALFSSPGTEAYWTDLGNVRIPQPITRAEEIKCRDRSDLGNVPIPGCGGISLYRTTLDKKRGNSIFQRKL